MSKFTDILDRAQRRGIQLRTKESLDWFRKNASRLRMSQNSLMRENSMELVNSWTNIALGKLYFFTYDPKHKATLPYYDSFPLIIPFFKGRDHFKALNLHYLPPILRARFLDALYEIMSNERMDESTKFKMTYGLLKSASKYRFYKPCVKMYLHAHIRSRFLLVKPNFWEPALFLPVASWEKATAAEVWRDSREKMRD